MQLVRGRQDPPWKCVATSQVAGQEAGGGEKVTKAGRGGPARKGGEERNGVRGRTQIGNRSFNEEMPFWKVIF